MRLLTVLMIFLLAPVMLLAQEAVPELAQAPDAAKQLVDILGPHVVEFLVQYPLFGKVVLYLGLFRSVMKPLNSIVWKFVNFSQSEKDNLAYQKAAKHSVTGTILYLLDYFTSVKLKNPEKEK